LLLLLDFKLAFRNDFFQGLFIFLPFFILGILLSSLFPISQLMMLGFLIFGVVWIIISLFGRNKELAVLAFCLVLIGIGAWRYQIAESKIINNGLQGYNDQSQVILVGIVSGEPDVRESSTKLKIEAKV